MASFWQISDAARRRARTRASTPSREADRGENGWPAGESRACGQLHSPPLHHGHPGCSVWYPGGKGKEEALPCGAYRSSFVTVTPHRQEGSALPQEASHRGKRPFPSGIRHYFPRNCPTPSGFPTPIVWRRSRTRCPQAEGHGGAFPAALPQPSPPQRLPPTCPCPSRPGRTQTRCRHRLGPGEVQAAPAVPWSRGRPLSAAPRSPHGPRRAARAHLRRHSLRRRPPAALRRPGSSASSPGSRGEGQGEGGRQGRAERSRTPAAGGRQVPPAAGRSRGAERGKALRGG